MSPIPISWDPVSWDSNEAMRGFFGFIPSKESNTRGMTILPMFLLSSGSNFVLTLLDPELNRNIGKMVIPRVFDSLLGIKPKNPRIASLLSQETGSQDIGIGLTQFHSRIDKRVNQCSNRAQRARNFFSN